MPPPAFPADRSGVDDPTTLVPSSLPALPLSQGSGGPIVPMAMGLRPPSGAASRYELLGELGRGGMGVVMKAWDPDLGREVAVKVLGAELAADRENAQRFVEEAQVAGQLQHPGVVPVYDIGWLADGRPFFAMKLIEGRTLAELLVSHPDPTSDRGTFLQIFLKVCQAVAYAHSRGVIHRDLKPSNIMVGSFGEVQVMDWGIVKILTRRNLPDTPSTRIHTIRSSSGCETMAGLVLGTPSYMSPEQSSGDEDLDARADVFGLGAVLAVILTGHPPYVADTTDSLRMMSIQGNLTEAFARLDASSADRELIELCKRCLSRDRQSRPLDAGVVARAVQDYLAGVEDRLHAAEKEKAAAEVRAQAEANIRREAEARATEQRRKRRAQLALAACLLSLVGVSGLAVWVRERMLADQREEQARFEGERKAERATVEAEQAAIEHRMRSGVNAAILLASDLRDKFRFEEARAALDQAAGLVPVDGPEDLQKALRTATIDLTLVSRLDAIRLKRSVWKTSSGGKGGFQDNLAPPAYRAALLIGGIDIVGGDPASTAARIRNSSIRRELIDALDDWAVLEPDAAIRNRVLHTARAADPGPWLDHFRNPSLRASWYGLAWMARTADSRALQPGTLLALAVLMQQRGLDPTNLLLAAEGAHPRDFLIPFILGDWMLKKHDRAQSVAHYRVARALRSNNLAMLNNLGNALRETGDLDGAILCYQDAIKADPTFTYPYINLAIAQREKGRTAEAAATYRQVIRLDPSFATAHDNLAVVLCEMGDHQGALAAHREAIRLEPEYGPARANLGITLAKMGDVKGAIQAHREAVARDPGNPIHHNLLGVALQDSGDRKAALAAYREGIRHAPDKGYLHFNLAKILFESRDPRSAIGEYREAVRLEPGSASFHNGLGVALAGVGDMAGSIAALRESVRLAPSDPQGLTNLGHALGLAGKLDEALRCCQEARRLAPTFAINLNNMGLILAQKGDLAGAIECIREAIRHDPHNPSFDQNLRFFLQRIGERNSTQAPPPRPID
jgi:tetratricopeptide (TPR) repeat protein